MSKRDRREQARMARMMCAWDAEDYYTFHADLALSDKEIADAKPTPYPTAALAAVVGLSLDQAKALIGLSEVSYTVRIASMNGLPHRIAGSLSRDRINLIIEEDLVVEAFVG